jgi:hypothetical protein
MKPIKVKTMHIFNNDCNILRTIKIVSFFGITIFTKTVAHMQDLS